MKQHIPVTSTSAVEVQNVTALIQDQVSDLGSGLLLVSVPHTTAAIMIGEDDQELRNDYVKVAREAIANLKPFEHIRNDNPNTEAHVFSSLFGTRITLAVEDGSLELGTYQNLLFFELDGPKKRHMDVTFFPAGGSAR
jgi:secondary thiamine-phosphate synthase enzyme